MKKIFLIVLLSVIINSCDNNDIIDNEKPEIYTISLTTNSPDLGEVRGSGSFNHGTIKVLEAIPFVNNSFIGWYVNDSLYQKLSAITVSVNSNISLQARFESNKEGEYKLIHAGTTKTFYYDKVVSKGTAITIICKEKENKTNLPPVINVGLDFNNMLRGSIISEGEYRYTIPAQNSAGKINICGAYPLFEITIVD